MDAYQLEAYNACVYGDKSVFCTGGAGSGKSFVLSNIVRRLRERYRNLPGSVVVTASTGSAAFLIHGTTLHRFAGVGIEEKDVDIMIGRARRKSSIRNWKRVKILIIDEVSMLSGTLFGNLSLVAQNIKCNSEPFGGIRVLVFGDFLQLPPISNTRNGTIEWAFESKVWHDLKMKTIELRGCNRHGNDAGFAGLLRRLRNGSCKDEDIKHIKSLVREVKYADSVEPVRLYATKDKVARYNSYRLSQLETQSVTIHSTDQGTTSLLSQCPVGKDLELKVGSQVMLMRNVNNVLVNGSIGTLVEFEKDKEGNTIPIVDIVSRNSKVIKYRAEPLEWCIENADRNIVASRKQVPLILAWSITIHKSQGRTIPRLVVDMGGVFEEGQCYVALSRCPTDRDIQVLNFREQHMMTNSKCVKFYESVCNDNEATHVATDTQQTWDNQIASVARGLRTL